MNINLIQLQKLLSKLTLTGVCLMAFLATGCKKNEASQSNASRAPKFSVVAAENFYGSVAQQIAGNSANVTSILDNPNQDPHEFTSDAATAKSVADADIVIYSGIGYDDWMEKLLAAQSKAGRVVVRVGDLIGATNGDNPHIWYDPRTMPALAAKLAEILKQPDNLAAFQKEMIAVTTKIAEIKSAHEGTTVTATEPVFGWMANALGFKTINNGFQWAVMNDTEPSFSQTADFEKSLRDKTVKILFYNRQVTDPTTERMLKLAQESGVPVVGTTETQPPDAKDYVDWMLSELNATEAALTENH